LKKYSTDGMTSSSNEGQHLNLLRELVHFLHLHHSSRRVENFEKKIENMQLDDLKIELFPFSHQYLGDLLQPENKRILEGFVQISAHHAHSCVVDWDRLMQALEFAYASEIDDLQNSYGCAKTSWGKSMTSEEHSLLLSNGLTDKEEIKAYIKKVLAQHKRKNTAAKKLPVKEERITPGDEEMSPRQAAAEEKQTEDDLTEALFENKALHKIIAKAVPKVLSEAASDTKRKSTKKTKPKAPSKKQKKEHDPKDVEEKDEGGSSLVTRQRNKEIQRFMQSCPMPVVPPLVNHFADTGMEVYAEILRKEDEMLDILKEMHKEYRELRPIIRSWKKGFNLVYLFWMNLQISKAAARLPPSNNEAQWLKSLYTQQNDIDFVLLVGQPQASTLHKMQYHLDSSAEDILHRHVHIEEGNDGYSSDLAMEEGEEGWHGLAHRRSHGESKDTLQNFQLWKDYLQAINGGESKADKKWNNNYRFFSIKVFKAIHASSKPPSDSMLDTAFDICSGSKDIAASPADHNTVMQKKRLDRYTAICKQVAQDISLLKPLGHKKHIFAATWMSSIHWDPYWNLINILQKRDHPLVNLLLPKRLSSSKQKAQEKNDVAAVSAKLMDNSVLDAKTRDRFYQWWSMQRWEKVCLVAKIPLA
jgi:hypothetical protein